MSEKFEATKASVEHHLLTPVLELIEAATEAVAAADRRAESITEVLETLLPVWAHGWTSDSQAAQSAGNALAGLWRHLGVKNQTAAMARLAAIGAETTRLRETLRLAAEQFESYQRQHEAKGTADGRAKAETNLRFAVMCRDAIAEGSA